VAAARRNERLPAVHDIKWIREYPEAFNAGLRKRGLAPGGEIKFAAELVELDDARRRIVTELQHTQARRNLLSKEIGAARAAKDASRAQALMADVAALKDQLTAGEKRQADADRALHDSLLVIPNLPSPEVPIGADAAGNRELRRGGTAPPLLVNRVRPHYDIGEALGLMDFQTAAKLSGARFVVLKGRLARLERALAQFMLDVHTTEFAYTEISPPLLVRDEAMFGTAQLPKFRDDQFATMRHLPLDDAAAAIDRIFDAGGATPTGMQLAEALRQELAGLWLIPTAEVPLTNLVRETIREEAELPIRVTACTPCFRAEAGAAGKDTRGMIRQHQFWKVELVSITTPDQSAQEHERMTQCAEEILKRLGLAYRTMLLCTGDMGFAAQKTYDIEVWLPGQEAYREISSCSLCGDFQARRMQARYRPSGGKELRYVHTLNGSGLAVGRTLIAILENYQQPDGSVAVPDALQPYMGGARRIEKG
jgi:seryl-tRNA synthetase